LVREGHGGYSGHAHALGTGAKLFDRFVTLMRIRRGCTGLTFYKSQIKLIMENNNRA